MKNVFKKVFKNVAEKLGKGREVLLKEEKGASELVVVVALIVIVLAVAIIFRAQLANIVTALGNKVITWIGNN